MILAGGGSFFNLVPSAPLAELGFFIFFFRRFKKKIRDSRGLEYDEYDSSTTFFPSENNRRKSEGRQRRWGGERRVAAEQMPDLPLRGMSLTLRY
jgi:hypothetical protein